GNMAKMSLSHQGLKTRTFPADSPKGIRRLNLISEPPHSPIFKKRGPSAPFFFCNQNPFATIIVSEPAPSLSATVKTSLSPWRRNGYKKQQNKRADGH